jgi:leucyl aminopeptidase (aminopeptidase T)
MQAISSEDLNRVSIKLEEFMKYCQKLEANDSYLIVNRNSPMIAKAAHRAAKNCGFRVKNFNLEAKKPYKNFPKKLINLIRQETPKAGIGLFDYQQHPDWNLKEVGARIELLHQTIEQVPISWAHSPGITLDMAINGPLQCNYKKMAEESSKILQKLQNIKKIHIIAPGGTDIEIEVGKEVKFDTDCIIVPPNVYGKPGKFGNLPVGEVWSQKGNIIQVINKETGKKESQHYPVKQVANGILVCDVTAGGYTGKINPEKPITVVFRNGVLSEFKSEDKTFNSIKEDILTSQKRYGLPTVLEEVGIGLNDKARITRNMLEDEKIRGTCHLAPGNIRCHVDMLIDKPTITVFYNNGKNQEIIRRGNLA